MRIMPLKARSRGISLVEMIITVAVIGILSAIAVPTVGNIFGKSKEVVADNVVQGLNKATREFGHSQWDLKLTPVPNTGNDELALLRTLQWKEPTTAASELNPKGPFMRIDWNPSVSTDTEEFRIEWTGSAWRLLKPGTAGGGLKIDFEGTDLGTGYVHPDDFTPIGSR